MENSARGFGGGIGTEAGGFPRIQGSRFFNNEAGDGGGVCISASDAIISRCDVQGNVADFGGGMSVVSAMSVLIDRSVIAGNRSSTSGGGVHILYSGVDMQRSSVVFNECDGTGGGIYGHQSEIMVTTTVVSHNEDAGLLLDGGTAAIEYADMFGNQGGEIEGDPPPGVGILTGTNTNGDSIDVYSNIFLDPEYLGDDVFNLLLHESSPLIDAGDPGLSLDHDGSVADIGAYPYVIPLVLGVSVVGNTFDLQWSENDQTWAYRVYGTNSTIHFNPGEGQILEEFSEGITNWSTDVGFGDPASQWVFRVVAVDRYEREITRSNIGGEFELDWNIP